MPTNHTDTSPRIIAAHFPNTCWTCGARIERGSQIHYQPHAYRKPDGTTIAVVAHEACGLPVNPTPPKEQARQQAQPQATTGRIPTQQALPINTPTQSAQPTRTNGEDALAVLARALEGRMQPQSAQIDEGRVRVIAGEESRAAAEPLAQALSLLITASTDHGARLGALESAKPPTVELDEAAARKIAADEARAAITDARSKGAADLVVGGDVPSRDPLYQETETGNDIAEMLARSSHVLVSGPSGSGKTFPIEQECARLGRRRILVSCADGVTYSALVCRPAQTTPTLEYRLGPLPIAMRTGAVLILDEVDKLDPLLAALFHGPLEPDSRRRILVVPETGETIVAAPGFSIAATCNGLRDESGSYAAHRIDGAFLTRCRGVAADYLSAKDEAALFERAGLDAARSSALARTLAQLRTAHLRGDITVPPSTRLGVQWLRMVNGRADDGSAGPKPIAPDRAWRLAFLNLLTPAQALAALRSIDPQGSQWKESAA